MDRRRFLRYAAGATAGALLAPSLLRAFPDDAAAAFARGRKQYPWLQGWSNVRAPALGPSVLKVEGRIPKGLAGALYRNGPAQFERDGFRYQHWFDGDGMVHGWKIDAGRVTHRARMVQTDKFRRESALGRFAVPAAGTTVPDALPARNNDDMNTANTAVIAFGGKLFALWEAGSPYELDRDDLETKGTHTFRADLTAAPFSAHPLVERDGSLWNMGSLAMLGANALLIWHVGADGQVIDVVRFPTEGRGFIHSFAMTERHLLFALMPFDLSGGGQALFERMHFRADQPCRVALVPKDDLANPQWFEAPFAAIYHWADAYERDGVVHARAVRQNDLEKARSPQAAVMRGGRDADAGTDLVSLRIDLKSRQARWIEHGIGSVEFPTFDGRAPGAAPRTLYVPTSAGKATAPFFNAFASVDLEREKIQRFGFGEHYMVEEHRFVPRPGGSRDDDGWLVGTVLDFKRSRTGLSILDARHVGDGPVAMAFLEHSVPLGFHGWFAPA